MSANTLHINAKKKKKKKATNQPFTIMIMPNNKPTKLNRNSPCPCGSGRKYKKCCFTKCDCSEEEEEEGTTKNKPQQEMYCKSCYRFRVGDRVGAAMGETFRPGTIVALNYSEPGWLGDVPYQIELEGGKLVFAPHDEDDWVRALPMSEETTTSTASRRRRRRS